MNLLDKHYLTAQFLNRIYKKNGKEFQSFFEDIMEKAFPDFRKIMPYGAKGDAGNDGFRKEKGIYYQVYSPNTPVIQQSKAAEKLKDDFEKLKKGWNQISCIREYYFVFNDKYTGSTIVLEQAISELEKSNKNIKFENFTAKDLEKVFFALEKSDILNLNFNIDSTKAISNAHELMDKIEIDLDRESGIFAFKTLENIKEIIFGFYDEKLELEYELLECRCLHKLEKVEEAKLKYENLSKKFPSDPRSYLYLAEIYLNDTAYDKNAELLKKSEKINSDHWLLRLEKLVRNFRLRNKINLSEIDEKSFPEDLRIRSSFYRLYSQLIEQTGNQKADSFIEKAITCNPERFSNYLAKFSILANRIFSSDDNTDKIQQKLGSLLSEINNFEEKFLSFGDIGYRNRAVLNAMKLNIFLMQQNFSEFVKLAKESFEYVIMCYFDQIIDEVLVNILNFVELPHMEFDKLLNYLKKSKNTISDRLAKIIIIQFAQKNKLFKNGKRFIREIKKDELLSFISDIEEKDYDKVLAFLKDDIPFAITISNVLKDHPILRNKIIENLPTDKNIQKEKLLLLLNYDEGNIDEAFHHLQKLDLSSLSYLECEPMLRIAQKKEAWEFQAVILEKLLENEEDKKISLDLELQLFNAYKYLEKFPLVIKIGENILFDSEKLNILNNTNKEFLLGNTIYSYLRRGEYKEALELIIKFHYISQTFEFKVGIEADVYIKNDNPKKSLESVIDGVKAKKRLSAEEYADLFFIFNQIKNLLSIDMKALKRVENNSFIKAENQDWWYFVGDDNELDATKIASSSKNYSLFINKKIGDKIVFSKRYRSKEESITIENILPIDKYVIWQCEHYFQILSREERWDRAKMIEVPEKDGSIDLKYLLAFLEDKNKDREPFFKMYCKGNVPLALLAVLEGGLTNAFGCIQRENKGFINCSTGMKN